MLLFIFCTAKVQNNRHYAKQNRRIGTFYRRTAIYHK